MTAFWRPGTPMAALLAHENIVAIPRKSMVSKDSPLFRTFPHLQQVVAMEGRADKAG